ncbi:MAG: citrate lyase holo-[Mogibacterium sp.]|nr:citrate lyase holo-[acyl-carrier protein] synthase [Mogibacterium sp.]MBR4090151.1 citrate lyase holo-[acyl-carrier protein] synthase [Mogibacterium sp.]
MKSYSVDLEQMLAARERRAFIQNRMLEGAGPDRCLVCLTMNIAGDVKRTPMIRMLFDTGIEKLKEQGFRIAEEFFLDEVSGCEAFWLLDEEGAGVKALLEGIEDSFPAARLFDFDVIVPGGCKLSRAIGRRCLICDSYAAECARSRRHGLGEVKKATEDLLKAFCAGRLAEAAHASLMDELYTTPKPGLVDMSNNGAHTDMDVTLFEKSADALAPYFKDAALLGMERCGIGPLRERGIRAEEEMLAATGGVNTHKGLIYSMGLLLAGMGSCLANEGGSCIENAAGLACQDAEDHLIKTLAAPVTNGGAVYKTYGARGATGEAAAGFPDAVYCLERLSYYRKSGCRGPASLALCDSMAVLEDTNLLHRGGRDGLEYVRDEAARISAMPPDERIDALHAFDRELISRGLSPGGSADMLALAFLLERWKTISAFLSIEEREVR